MKNRRTTLAVLAASAAAMLALGAAASAQTADPLSRLADRGSADAAAPGPPGGSTPFKVGTVRLQTRRLAFGPRARATSPRPAKGVRDVRAKRREGSLYGKSGAGDPLKDVPRGADPSLPSSPGGRCCGHLPSASRARQS